MPLWFSLVLLRHLRFQVPSLDQGFYEPGRPLLECLNLVLQIVQKNCQLKLQWLR